MRNPATASQDSHVFFSISGCRKNHLIADNLGWFQDGGTNIEQIMQEKGLAVTRVKTPNAADCVNEPYSGDALQPQLADNNVFEALGNQKSEK